MPKTSPASRRYVAGRGWLKSVRGIVCSPALEGSNNSAGNRWTDTPSATGFVSAAQPPESPQAMNVAAKSGAENRARGGGQRVAAANCRILSPSAVTVLVEESAAGSSSD